MSTVFRSRVNVILFFGMSPHRRSLETKSSILLSLNFQELEQVHREQFETNAQVLAEDHVVFEVHYVHDVFGVILF